MITHGLSPPFSLPVLSLGLLISWISFLPVPQPFKMRIEVGVCIYILANVSTRWHVGMGLIAQI